MLARRFYKSVLLERYNFSHLVQGDQLLWKFNLHNTDGFISGFVDEIVKMLCVRFSPDLNVPAVHLHQCDPFSAILQKKPKVICRFCEQTK